MTNNLSLDPFKDFLEEIWEEKNGSNAGFETAWTNLENQDNKEDLSFFDELTFFNNLILINKINGNEQGASQIDDPFDFSKEPFENADAAKNYLDDPDNNFTSTEREARNGTKVKKYYDDNDKLIATTYTYTGGALLHG